MGGPPVCVPPAVKSDAFLVRRGRPRWVLGLPCCNPAAAVDRRGRAWDAVGIFVEQFPTPRCPDSECGFIV